MIVDRDKQKRQDALALWFVILVVTHGFALAFYNSFKANALFPPQNDVSTR